MADTAPSGRSATSVYLSNGADLVAIWHAGRLTQTGQTDRGPGIAEMHFLGGRASNWSTNQVLSHTGCFRDDSGGYAYTDVASFAAEAWLESAPDRAGTLTSRYGAYAGATVQPRVAIVRSHVAVPSLPFFVIRYSVTNPTGADLTVNLLDELRVNNVGAHDPDQQVHGWRDTDRNVLVADMSASGQYFVVLGAFDPVDAYQVGDDTELDRAAPAVSPAVTFAHDGTLAGNGDVHAATVDLAINKRIVVSAGTTATVDLFVTVRGTLDTALAAADLARSKPAQDWCDAAAKAHTAWLAAGEKGRRPRFADAGLSDHYDRALLMIKNMQHPTLGTIVASSNPIAYGYKTWLRDASIAAIALDASGHHEEAAKYWRWMASVQGNDGTWKTTYDFWTGAYISFVEPEYDSVGMFLYGIYRHHRATGDARLHAEMWPVVQRAANWLLSSISSNGFAAPDYSIWEEQLAGLQHNSFTQAWFVAGLWATQCMAEARGDTALSDWYAGGAASIQSALQRPSTWQPPGTWNPAGYYNRGVSADDTPVDLHDSSSNLLIALGIVDRGSERSTRHMATIAATLSHNGYGLARYTDDVFYYSAPWNPAGDEVGAPEPSWPQMSMWVSMHDSADNRDAALQRLQWFVSTTGIGYMPQGEAVSNVTGLPVLSSMSEPLTAGSFVLASLAWQRIFDVRIRPPIVNAGTFKALSLNPGTVGDWDQWRDVPYLVGSLARRPKLARTTIRRVYLANDAGNIFVRIDNVGGSLPEFGEQPAFAVRLYSSDLSGATSDLAQWDLDRRPLNRPACFAVGRLSTDDVFFRWTVDHGEWVAQAAVGAAPPQWDPASGRIELAVPTSALGAGFVDPGQAWITMTVALAHQDGTGSWIDDDRVVVHYRFSTADQSWIYGDIEY